MAHVGDSRAVLCRAGHTVSITEDHKPDSPDEKARYPYPYPYPYP